MPDFRHVLALLALTTTACQVMVPSRLASESGKPDRVAVKPAGTPASSATPASAAPSVGPSASPSAAIAPSAPAESTVPVLRKPAGAVRQVTGTVAIDAYYAAAAGGGRLISNNGAQAIAFGTHTFVSNGSGNVISNNAGNILSDNGASYITLQADAKPGLGEVLPAAGMAIRAISMRTGASLPLGEDAAGKPVYEVYSSVQGGYQLFLPEAELQNVLLKAFVPGSADARLDVSAVVSADEAAPTLDEDYALVADFLRQSLADQMNVDLLVMAGAPDEAQAVAAMQSGYREQFRPHLPKLVEAIYPTLKQVGAGSLEPARRRQLAARIADAALAHVKLKGVQTVYTLAQLPYPEVPAMGELVLLMRENREGMRTLMRKLQAEGKDVEATYANDAIVKRVNEFSQPPFVIKTPGDAMVFYVRGLMDNRQLPPAEILSLMAQLVTNPNYNIPADANGRVAACIVPVQEAYMKVFAEAAAAADVGAAIAAGVATP